MKISLLGIAFLALVSSCISFTSKNSTTQNSAEIITKEENFVAGKYTTHYISEVNPVERVVDLKSEEDLAMKVISTELNYLRGENEVLHH